MLITTVWHAGLCSTTIQAITSKTYIDLFMHQNTPLILVFEIFDMHEIHQYITVPIENSSIQGTHFTNMRQPNVSTRYWI